MLKLIAIILRRAIFGFWTLVHIDRYFYVYVFNLMKRAKRKTLFISPVIKNRLSYQDAQAFLSGCINAEKYFIQFNNKSSF